MKLRRLLLLSIGAVLACGAAPPVTPVSGTVETIDGRHFLRFEQWRGSPALLLLWSVDCPPCRVEIRSLTDIAKAFPGWQVNTIAVSERRQARAVIRDVPAGRTEHFAALPQDGPRLLARLGNDEGALPYAVALDANGAVCATWRGAMRPEVVRAMRAHCD